MKILLISTTILPIPLTGYGGTEQIVYLLGKELHRRGHIVAVAAPEGSKLPEGMELIPLTPREPEESAFQKYQPRLSEFDIIHDSSFESWGYQASIGVDPPLPIIKTLHTSPTIWGSPPPITHPCLVGISDSHVEEMILRWGVGAQRVYNGIDLAMYSPDATVKRNGRLLFLGRYTPEKGPLQAIQMAKRLKMPLDCYGDTQMVSDPVYVERCRKESDEVIVRFKEGVSRDKTVELYRTYRALLYLPAWNEPFGMVVCEAQACGMPVVTLRRGSMPEVVSDGVSGYVCTGELEVEDRLKNGMGAIKSEDCRTAAERFTVERMADGYLALYQRVIQGDRW